jgi:hypothetical protein
MLANFQAAKFNVVLVPISQIVLVPADRKDVTFDVFFSHTLMTVRSPSTMARSRPRLRN